MSLFNTSKTIIFNSRGHTKTPMPVFVMAFFLGLSLLFVMNHRLSVEINQAVETSSYSVSEPKSVPTVKPKKKADLNLDLPEELNPTQKEALTKQNIAKSATKKVREPQKIYELPLDDVILLQ